MRTPLLSARCTAVIRSTCCLLALTVAAALPASEPLDVYNVRWDSPSADASGSMPLGNGDLAANVWVDPKGDLCLYVSKSDAWTSIYRQVKLARLRLQLEPNPVAAGWTMDQVLVLRDAAITVTFTQGDEQIALRVWIDAQAPQIHLEHTATRPVALTAVVESLRPERRGIMGDEALSALGTSLGGRTEDPTVFLPATGDALVWYDRNERSWYPLNLAGQQLDGFAGQDPLLHRTFGAHLAGPGFRAQSADRLHAPAATTHHLVLTAHTAQTPTVAAWQEALAAQVAATKPLTESWPAHQAWWRDFWARSFLRFRTPAENPRRFAAIQAHDAPLLIGAGRSGREAEGLATFAGDIARVRISRRVFAAAELQRRAQAIDTTVPPDDLTADWHFTTVAEQYAPVHGDPALTAVVHGTVTRTDDGHGIRLGADSRMEVAHHATIGLDGPYTIEAWVRVDATTGGTFLTKSRIKGERPQRFSVGIDGQWREVRHVAAHAVFNTNSTIPTDTWFHIAVDADPATGQRRIFVNGWPQAWHPAAYTPDLLAQRWHLQRFVLAAAGRGDSPIKFNGSQFTFPTGRFNADYRRWGGCYWFQNTRLIYWPMLITGDYDLMQPFFRMYHDSHALARYRVQHYYGFEGAFWPETMTEWGSYKDSDYGKDRPLGEPANPWIRRYYSGNLELLAMMLDYVDHTGDDAFRRDTLLPIARDVIAFYEHHATTRTDDGKMVFHPAQALETHQSVRNPANEIAGLLAVLPRLIAQPEDAVAPDLRAHWAHLLTVVPPLPRATGRSGEHLMAYEETFAKPRNSENPELYAVFPFKLFGVGRPELDVARRTFARRSNTGPYSWQQNDIQAALLGLTDQAATMIQQRAQDGSYRFPGFWHRTNDWMPDQCSASNFLHSAALMAMQEVDGKIHVLPAWPADWDVHFKLHASQRTTVEVRYANGKLIEVIVEPASERHRLVLPE